MRSKRIVFMGTPEFALPSLQALCENGCNVVGAFTQPDRPKGRGNKTEPTPVKAACLEAGIPVFQFAQIKSPEGVAALRELHPDILITAAFGQMLSQEILDVPPMGCINVHASLLPQYRGAAPVQWAVIRGERVTGVTTMLTDIGMDTGAILLQDALTLDPEETAGTLMARLALLGGPLLVRTLQAWCAGTLQPTPQDDAQATKARPLRSRHEIINWTLPGREVVQWIRGLSPAPGAVTSLEDQRFKCYQAAVVDTALAGGMAGKPGEIITANPKQGLWVAAGDGVEVFGEKLKAEIFLIAETRKGGRCGIN